ncbi:MAG: thioredoxin fold domain-containing protein [Cytophagaceae bacterium]
MIKYLLLAIVFVSGSLLFGFRKAPNVKIAPASVERKVKKEKFKDDFKWLSYDEAVKLNSKKPRKIFIDVYTDWCGWCKKMDKATLSNPKITGYLKEKYYAVKLNAESNKMIKYKGKEMTEAQLARNVFGATGFPTTVYLDSEENLLQPIPGYMEVDILDKILHYYGEDHYKTTTWEQFQRNYDSGMN